MTNTYGEMRSYDHEEDVEDLPSIVEDIIEGGGKKKKGNKSRSRGSSRSRSSSVRDTDDSQAMATGAALNGGSSRSGLGLYVRPLKAAVRKTAEFGKTLPLKLMRLKDFLTAMLVLFVVIIVIVILVILFRYYHPRLCSVNRSAAFEKYMEGHQTEVEDRVFQLHDLLSKQRSDVFEIVSRTCTLSSVGQGLPSVQGMLASLEKLTRDGRDRFAENLRIYYKFYTTIKRLERPVYGFFAKRDILHEPRFNEKDEQTGEPKEVLDKSAVDRFEADFMSPLDELRGTLRALSSEMAGWDRAYHEHWFSDSMFELLTAVHLLHLLLNEYHEQITFSYDTRKALAMSLQFNIWTLYYVPYVEKTFLVRIPNIWKSFPETFTTQFENFQRGWAALGDLFASLPKKMANSNVDSFVQSPGEETPPPGPWTVQRYRTWSQSLLERNASSRRDAARRKRRKEEEEEGAEGYANEEEEDVVEPLGFLKGLLSVGEFFVNVVEVAIVIARVVINFVSDPVGSTIKLIFIILSVLLGLVLTLLHTLLTLIGVSFVLGFSWAWFVAFTISVWLTIVESIFVVILTVIFAVLWLVDLLTGGMVVRLMRCEDLPNEWEFRRNLAEGNTTVRALGLACCYPCAARFYPWGALCKRRPVYIPDYCPQQQIVSTFRNGKPFGGGFDDPFMFRGYPLRADPSIITKQRPEKESILADALRHVKNSLGTCYKRFSQYDYLNRHICHNVDRLPDDRYPSDVKRQLRALCYQAYCEYAPRDKGRGEIVADLVGDRGGCLCSYLRNLRKDEKPEPPPPESAPVRENTDDMFRRSLLMFLTALALLASVYTLSNTTSSMVFGGDSRRLRSRHD